MKKTFLLKTALIGATIGLSSMLFAKQYYYSGTDFLAGEIEKTISSEIKKIEQVEPTSSLKGSLLGEENLRKNLSDFAFLMFIDIKKIDEIKKGEWIAIPIAYQVAYVLVASSNNLEEISYKDLAAIYAQVTPEHYKSWVDLPKSNLKNTIIPSIGNTAESNAIPFFQYHVLPKGLMLPGVRSFSKNDEMMKFIKNSGHCICISNVPPTFDTPAKILAVSNARDENTKSAAYLPTQINIYNNDYPLSVPIYLVYPKKNESQVKKLYPAIFSKNVSNAIEKTNYIPLPKDIRENLEKTIDKAK